MSNCFNSSYMIKDNNPIMLKLQMLLYTGIVSNSYLIFHLPKCGENLISAKSNIKNIER